MDASRARIRNEILWEIESNAYDKDVLPHYGMVPDWKPRYDRLEQLVREYLISEREELGAQQWEEAQAKRYMQREAKILSSEAPNLEG